MGTIADDDGADPADFGFFDGDAHGALGDRRTEAVMPIDQCQSRRFLDDFEGRARLDVPFGDAFVIDRQTPYALALTGQTMQFTFHQATSTGAGFIFRHTHGSEGVERELFQ